MKFSIRRWSQLNTLEQLKPQPLIQMLPWTYSFGKIVFAEHQWLIFHKENMTCSRLYCALGLLTGCIQGNMNDSSDTCWSGLCKETGNNVSFTFAAEMIAFISVLLYFWVSQLCFCTVCICSTQSWLTKAALKSNVLEKLHSLLPFIMTFLFLFQFVVFFLKKIPF